MTGKASTAGMGRVLERRRAGARARHYREFEGLSIRQIADRLGRSPATVKAYFYDPTGEKLRAVKAAAVRNPGRSPRSGAAVRGGRPSATDLMRSHRFACSLAATRPIGWRLSGLGFGEHGGMATYGRKSWFASYGPLARHARPRHLGWTLDA